MPGNILRNFLFEQRNSDLLHIFHRGNVRSSHMSHNKGCAPGKAVAQQGLLWRLMVARKMSHFNQ
jgi:hypothetical protein